MATKSQRARENLSEKTITKKYADDVLLNIGELAEALRVSRWTIDRWRKREDGYIFLYGKLTTPAHAKAWLARQAEKASQASPEDERMGAVLRRMND
jgi:hypothetical protein